jgi:hypothetical protein
MYQKAVKSKLCKFMKKSFIKLFNLLKDIKNQYLMAFRKSYCIVLKVLRSKTTIQRWRYKNHVRKQYKIPIMRLDEML